MKKFGKENKLKIENKTRSSLDAQAKVTVGLGCVSSKLRNASLGSQSSKQLRAECASQFIVGRSYVLELLNQ